MMQFWQVPMGQWAMAEQFALERVYTAFHGLTHSMLKKFGENATVTIGTSNIADEYGAFSLADDVINRFWTPMMADWVKAFSTALSESVNLSLGGMARYHMHVMSEMREQLGHGQGEPYGGPLPFSGSAEQVRAAAASRLWSDNFSLSGRIWKLDQNSKMGIRNTIYNGIAAKKSTVDIARDVERFLGFGQDCTRWTAERMSITPEQIMLGDKTGLVYGSGCDSKSVAYNAVRLARTELQFAHSQAASEMMQNSPFISGEQLYLHDLHPPGIKCQCEDEVGFPASRVGPVRPVGYYNGAIPFHPNCSPPGQTVTTQDGEKPIEQIRKGDKVLTHKNRFRTVTNLSQRAYKGKLVKIKTRTGKVLRLTPEHPVLVNGIWKTIKDVRPGDSVQLTDRGQNVQRDS